MSITRFGFAGGALILASVAFATAAPAHGPQGPEERSDLEALVEQANLVAMGTVSNVKYVNVTSEQGNVPHTIVTYKLKESLRGKPSGETFSLRFMGGSDGMGGFMTVTGVPLFQEGEQDILFVQGNGEDGRCPLVNCEYGRFRVHQNQVFNTHGQPVRAIRGQRAIARGRRAEPFQKFSYPAPSFDDLMKNSAFRATLEKMGRDPAATREEYDRRAPKQITWTRRQPPTRANDKAGQDPDAKGRASGGKPESPIGAAPLGVDAMVAKIKELHGKSRRQPAAVASANPEARIEAPRAGNASPGRSDEKAEPPQQSDADKEEVRRLKAQGYNPVLPKQ